MEHQKVSFTFLADLKKKGKEKETKKERKKERKEGMLEEEMQLFFSEKHVALHLGYRPSESTAAARTPSYEHNDKGIFIFTKQPDRFGAQPEYRWCTAHSSRFAADVKNECGYASSPPYAVMV
jgi:hypothetical protein